MKLRLLPALLLLFNFLDVFSQSKLADSTRSGPRIYQTHRIPFTERPAIDGKLNDACWKTIEWSGNYTQWIPNEGAQPSQPTQLKVLYDDKNIYAAIRAIDREPEKIIRKTGRRDEFIGVMVGICFDSYHDRRTGFEFDVGMLLRFTPH